MRLLRTVRRSRPKPYGAFGRSTGAKPASSSSAVPLQKIIFQKSGIWTKSGLLVDFLPKMCDMMIAWKTAKSGLLIFMP